MKTIAALLVLLALAGCTSKTEFGECVGMMDDKKPGLEYKASGWNIAMGIIFVELIFPPVLVVVDQFHCPVGKK